jgi:EmrB/QacA subfamily drug resistance transporter
MSAHPSAGDISRPVPASDAPTLLELGTAPGRWLLLVAVLASTMAFLDASAVNVALPAIGMDLGASLSGLQWIITGYTLALASLVLLGGALGDRYGRRRVFLIGVIWFAAASIVCGLAPTTELLIAARVLQGIGGALLTPGALSLIQTSFRPEDRAQAIGLWSGLGGIAGLGGPFLGGFLVDTASWRWIFLVNLPLAIVVVAVAIRHVPESRDPAHHGRFDVLGALLAAIALGGVTYALIDAGAGPDTWVVLAVGLAAGVGFVLQERRAADPMLPLSMFSNRQFSGANLSTLAVYGALGGFSFFLVVQLQTVLGYSALQAGAAMTPAILVLSLLSSRAGKLATQIGPRLPMTIGPLIAAAGVWHLSYAGAGTRWLSGILPGSLVFGLGMALVVAPLTATVLGAAPTHLAGVASGVNNAVARAAGLLVVAALPVAVGLSGDDYTQPEVFTNGYALAMRLCAVLLALGGLIAWLTVRNDVLEEDPA